MFLVVFSLKFFLKCVQYGRVKQSFATNDVAYMYEFPIQKFLPRQEMRHHIHFYFKSKFSFVFVVQK